MAQALLGIVGPILVSFVKGQLATILGVDQQMKKLSSNFEAIQAVLRDAERKQITSHAVKDWLQKLTDAAYVLEDILDECSIHSTKMRYDDGQISFLSRLHPEHILFRSHIGKRMKKISQRFHDIHEEKITLRLLDTGATEVETVDDWRETTSANIEPIFSGRDDDQEKIVKFLTEDANNSEDLTIYPIVGMGGLGKTTLAEHVLHDHRVCKHFDLTIWVYVSVDFNVKAILQSIIENVTGQNPNLHTLETMRKKVEEVLHDKKYLLVLDDVWNEDQEKWKHLKGMLPSARGAKGATVLVTTRLVSVASIMETQPAYSLGALSEDDSWSLLKNHAFGSNREEREEFKEIGKEIVRKCVCSPLAIKTLGRLLRGQNEVRQWKNVKESEIWDIQEESSSNTGEDNSIIRALKLSYFNLESSWRRCFSFCAIFPKGFEMNKEDLIHLWVANGFIRSEGSEGSEGSVEVENEGDKVWKKLYHRSFFEEAKCDEFGIITGFKMHDLFHDLAMSIMSEECTVIVEGRLPQLPSRIHFLRFANSKVSDDVTSFKQSFNNAFKKVDSLRTFIDFGYIGREASNHWVPSNRYLRPLRTRSSLPIKDFSHLRYLNVCENWEASLDNSICQLRKLQILKLKHCYGLRGLPKDLTQLQDLRHIVTEECPHIVETPPNIRELRHLKALGTFVVRSKPGYGLPELSGLKLGGTLRIKGLENVLNEQDAEDANLIGKNLNILHLSWDGNVSSEGSNVSVEGVLEALKPRSTLKSFRMNGYPGSQFSSWMRSPEIMRGLVEVKLSNFVNCEELPPLGKLPHLKRLEVSGMMNVKFIDGETYDGMDEKAFPSLEKLTMRRLPNLERLLSDEGEGNFPRLSQLTIDDVTNLTLPRLPYVKKLQVINIDKVASIMEGIVGNMCRLAALEDLSIIRWNDMENFPEDMLKGLTSLRILYIENCHKLNSLSEAVQHLACLESLEIIFCPVNLPSQMSKLTALRYVSIWSGSELPASLQHVPSLRSLNIVHCASESLPGWLGKMTSLQQLSIGHCMELKSLSSIQPLTKLSYLHIYSCPRLKKRCKRGTGEEWQYIQHIPNIHIS